MRNALLISGLLFISFVSAIAKVTTINYARQVATNFYDHQAHTANSSLTLVYTASNNNVQGNDTAPLFYIFNVDGSKGFVIVSAEDLVKPVLGYSLSGSFIVNKMPPAVAFHFNGYKRQISYTRINATEPTTAIAKQWADYYNNHFTAAANARSQNTVAALCTTTWDQDPYYNDFCPDSAGTKVQTVTGCVATAMGQIMKYWNYPPSGSGIVTDYYQSQTLSVDLDTVHYNWADMPDFITTHYTQVAKLIYNCGVAVAMDYGTIAQDGSGAQAVSYYNNAPSAQSAYPTNFGYDPSIQGAIRQGYSDNDWINMIKAELDTSRPVQYDGYGADGGHSWVCDGYDENNYFHMNWGWGGNSNGYYSIDNLAPEGLGGSNLNNNEDAIIGIQPLIGAVQPSLVSLSAATAFSQSPYLVNTPLTVSVDILNSDTAAFYGSFIGSIYTKNGTLLTNLQEYQGISIGAGKDTVISFSSTGIFGLPGDYTFIVSYKSRGISYITVPAGNFSNPSAIKFISPVDNMVLDSSIVVAGGDIIVSKSYQVFVNIKNTGAYDFSGTIGAELFDVNGNFVSLIDSAPSIILVSGYSNRYAFNGAALDIAPGVYSIAIYLRDDSNNLAWTLVDKGIYTNPLLVNVETQLAPDIYEINNTVTEPYTFTPDLSASSAEVLTTGSNIHIASDKDYYKIDVPDGNYTINAHVYDSENPYGQVTFSNKVVFSFTTDGSNFSSEYEGTMPVINGYKGGPITFYVTNKNAGSTGTYLLDVKITSDVTGINETVEKPLTVSPNPVQDALVIDAGSLAGKFELAIYNILGQKMISRAVEIQQGQLINENLAALSNGMYIVRLLSGDVSRETKIIVSH